jgi:hypothetical protein
VRSRPLRTLTLGLAALLLVAVVVASRPADRRVALNGTLVQSPVATLTPGVAACQPDTIVPDARRLRVPAQVEAGGLRARAVVEAGGRRAVGEWAPAKAGALVVPLPAGVPPGPAGVCIESEGPGQAQILGQPTGEVDRLRLGEGAGSGRMRVAFLYGSGPEALWSHALGQLPQRIAAAGGSAWAPWVVLLGLALALGAVVALLAGVSRRREIVVVALLGFGSAASWSGMMPLFQAGDELAHASYVQVLAELGHPPRDRRHTGELPEELACWAGVQRLDAVRFYHAQRPPWERAGGDPCAGKQRRNVDAAQYQATQPPGYYALATVGYRAGDALGRPLPDRLLLARLVSALLAAVTVVCAFLFVREMLPASPWAARAGALAAGLQPVMMFNHGVVNNDALLFATASAIAAVLARTWRRGPSPRRAVLLGALLGIGLLAKITFILLIPLVAGVQLLIALRGRSLPLRRRLALLAVAWGVALVPAVAYTLAGDAIWEPSAQTEANVAAPTHVGKAQMASHVWQAFLPRLPFMHDAFAGREPPAVHGLLEGPSGRLGWWDDYGIGSPWATLLLLAAVGLVLFAVHRAARRRDWRLPLAAVLAVAAGYVLLLTVALFVPGSYQVQGRYMGTLTPLWALAAAVAVSAVRPARQGQAVAILALAMLSWWALAMEATVSRWYL